jgi:hypothetical protein
MKKITVFKQIQICKKAVHVQTFLIRKHLSTGAKIPSGESGVNLKR